MLLSIIIPVYNEEKNLQKNIRDFAAYLNKQPHDHEIIIVNDGSTDDTPAVINRLSSKFTKIKVIDYQINQGKGKAVREGLLAAQGEYALFLDADGATAIDHLDFVWPYIDQGYDLVIGTRSPKDAINARIITPQAGWKQILGKAGNLLIQTITRLNIWDTQCGFKVLSRRTLDKIIPLTTVNRWAIDVEILILAKKFGYEIALLPVSWKNVPGSRVGIWGYPQMLLEILKIKWKLMTKKYD